MIEGMIAACEWGASPLVFFSENVFSPLIYYSHLTPVLVSLIFGFFIYFANRKSLLNKVLLFIALTLSVWLLLDLILWATDSLRTVVFAWSLVNMIEPIIYAGFVYFVLVFMTGNDISWKTKLLIVLPLLPTIALTATHWNIIGFNLTDCDREVIEGPMAYYNYLVEILYVLWIIGLGIRSWAGKQAAGKKGSVMLVIGATLILLLGFASGNIIGSFSEDWTIGQYGLFVIPVSIGALSYFVIQAKFVGKSQTMAAQVLVIGLWLAVFSILFIQNISVVRWIVAATLVFLAILGYILIRSFQHEVQQRKEIELLAGQLQLSNRQQVTLIHFITHQIKGFVTKSRNIFSLIKEGDFGPIPESMKPMVEEGFKSDTKGIATIQEILNAANIKSGKVEYKKESFDIKALVEEVIDDLKGAADAKGLAIISDMGTAPVMYPGDKGQLVNALKNVIDNSIKYTPKGEVRVSLKQEGKILRFVVEDTGVGITKEDMDHLFTEGGHGANSTKINVESTGFGLYIVKNIIEAHGGTVRAESDGPDKGSRFTVELPL
jgi:signal transduction histidine kinase